VLSHYISNPQCEQVLLACFHDAGYIPVLRKYAAQTSCSKRISLLSVGAVRQEMTTVRFKTTPLFEPLFHPKVVHPVANGRVRQPSVLSPDTTEASSSRTAESSVVNSERLRPIIRNGLGKRIDKIVSVDKGLMQALRKKNLCIWHYLRSNYSLGPCKRNHNYPRPLSSEEFDALWLVAREGMWHSSRKGGVCDDDQCIYGHGTG
jgi:hypothetical protein